VFYYLDVNFKAAAEDHELCEYAKISLHIDIIVDLNQNIA